MKTKMSHLALFLTLVFSLNVFANELTATQTVTRAVKVTEGAQSKLYYGNLFGQTLYTFDMDQNGQSACIGGCAEKWPALLVSAEEAQSLASPYSTIKRASGLLQVTLRGKPLYTYFLDHAEGDDKGDGVGGVWHDIDFE